MDSTLVAAIISSSIALLSIIATTLITRAQYLNQQKLQKKDFELRTQELEITINRLTAEYEALKQSQFTEVLKKRIDVYPKIWGVFVDYMINWKLEGKPRNLKWANEFLTAINHCNSETGVFFSHDFYSKFAIFRDTLVEVKMRGDDGIEVTENDVRQLESMYFGSKETGIAATLKDDLGSYGELAIKKVTG